MPTLTIWTDRHFDLLTDQQEATLKGLIVDTEDDPGTPSAHLGYDTGRVENGERVLTEDGSEARTVDVNGEPRRVSLIEHEGNATTVDIPGSAEDHYAGWGSRAGQLDLALTVGNLLRMHGERHYPHESVVAVSCDDEAIARMASALLNVPVRKEDVKD